MRVPHSVVLQACVRQKWLILPSLPFNFWLGTWTGLTGPATAIQFSLSCALQKLVPKKRYTMEQTISQQVRRRGKPLSSPLWHRACSLAWLSGLRAGVRARAVRGGPRGGAGAPLQPGHARVGRCLALPHLPPCSPVQPLTISSNYRSSCQGCCSASGRMLSREPPLKGGGGRSRAVAGSWDVSRYGPVYALAVGPYGAVLALCWQRDAEGQPSHVVWLDDTRGERASKPYAQRTTKPLALEHCSCNLVQWRTGRKISSWAPPALQQSRPLLFTVIASMTGSLGPCTAPIRHSWRDKPCPHGAP